MIETIEKAETLANEARNSISTYCFTECNAYCCRKGHLVLTSNELDLVANTQKKSLEEKNAISILNNGKYSMDFDLNEKSCPSLKDNKCIIHKDPLRPLACKEFPLFIRGNNLLVSQRCPAAKDNLLYPYIAEFKLMGFNLVYGKETFLE